MAAALQCPPLEMDWSKANPCLGGLRVLDLETLEIRDSLDQSSMFPFPFLHCLQVG
jgi:hypothetical protein